MSDITPDKIKWRNPWSTWKNDGTYWEINSGNIAAMALIGFLVGSVIPLVLLMKFIVGGDFMTHVFWFYKHQFLTWTNIGPYFNINSYIKYDAIFIANTDRLGPIYLAAYFFGILTAIPMGWSSAKPIDPLKHNRGRRLYSDVWKKMAFWEVLRIANRECKATPSSYHLPMFSSKGLDPRDPSTYTEVIPERFFPRLKYEFLRAWNLVNRTVWFSVHRLNTHFLIYGATRTGKSQAIKRMLHLLYRMQIIFSKHFAGTLSEEERVEFKALIERPYSVFDTLLISLGVKVQKKKRFPTIPKMVIFDVKGEYSKELYSKHCHYLSAHDLESARWKVARDLRIKTDATQFFGGWIKVDPRQPIWGESGITYGAAGIVYNQTFNGEDWTLGNLAWFYIQDLEFKQKFVDQHYLEAYDTFHMAGDTLSSVMGTFGAEVTPVIVQLADIYCGYYYKQDIAQLTTTLLRREHNIVLFSKSLFPTETTETKGDQVSTFQHPTNIVPGILMRGLVRAVNKEHPLPETIYDSKKRPVRIDNEKYRWEWEKLVALIKQKPKAYWSTAWNNLTAEEKQIVENERNGAIMKELLQKAFTESGKNEFSEFFATLGDDFNLLFKPENFEKLSKFCKPDYLGKLSDIAKNPEAFFQKDTHKYFVNGCLPIHRNYRIWEHYETSFEDVSLYDWLYDPMPKKPNIIFKSSGRIKKLNNGIIRGMSAYMAGIIDDDMFPETGDLKAEQQRDIWFFCDEFPFFGDMKITIDPILARGASKAVKIVLAAQDLSQFESEYDANFVKFVNSNVGNIMVTGTNAGETADKISQITGKRFFGKWHHRDNGTGQGSSEIQEHEGTVITPDEVTSKLGAIEGKTRTLYMGARYFNDAYIIHQPVISYKKAHKIKPALWVQNIKPNPKIVDIDELLRLAETTDEDDSTSGTPQQKVDNPSFEDLVSGAEEGYSKEDEAVLFAQEEEEFRKAQLAMNLAIANSLDLPLEIDEDELEQELIAEKLIEEIFGHEIGMAKISLELIDNFMQSRKVTITPEQKAILIKYANKQQPQPVARTQRLNIEDLYKE